MNEKNFYICFFFIYCPNCQLYTLVTAITMQFHDIGLLLVSHLNTYKHTRSWFEIFPLMRQKLISNVNKISKNRLHKNFYIIISLNHCKITILLLRKINKFWIPFYHSITPFQYEDGKANFNCFRNSCNKVALLEFHYNFSWIHLRIV